MAAAFAKACGSDVLAAECAGLHPAGRTSALARMVMAERRVQVPAARPRGLQEVCLTDFDLIVNLTGEPLPPSDVPVLRYSLPEPDGRGAAEYRDLRDRVEALVSDLVVQLRDVCRRYGAGAAA